MKRPIPMFLLDAIVVPGFWLTRRLLALLESAARAYPHSMQAGFSDAVDALRFESIRAKLQRGQKVLTAPDGQLLVRMVEEGRK